MWERFGSRPEDLVVAIGPGIGVAASKLVRKWRLSSSPFFPERTDLDGKTKIDLAETIRRQLGRNGVTVGQIVTAGTVYLLPARTVPLLSKGPGRSRKDGQQRSRIR